MKFRKNTNYNARKIHRYLGVFMGVQFFFWALGGLYFSWNNMDDVHGETLTETGKNNMLPRLIFLKFKKELIP